MLHYRLALGRSIKNDFCDRNLVYVCDYSRHECVDAVNWAGKHACRRVEGAAMVEYGFVEGNSVVKS